MQSEEYSTLVVTKDSKISSQISAMLMPPLFNVQIVSDYNEARRMLGERSYNIIIVDSGDGSETELSIDASNYSGTVLLLAPSHLFDQISYRVEGYGIITVTKPFDAFYFYNMIKAAIAVQYKIQVLTSQTSKLKEKMEEIRIVNRAKMLLMQNIQCTEQDAHRLIEKEAMDKCSKKILIAKQIVEKYS